MRFLLIISACQSASAPAPFSSQKTTSIAFEVDHVAGRIPNAAALTRFTGRLQELQAGGALAKPQGFKVTQDDEIAAHAEANHGYSLGELDALITRHKQTKTEGSVARAYFLYVDGHFDEDTDTQKTLGFAYGGDRIVMFADTIKNACSGLLFSARVCELAEASVLIHEFGHLLGLVNNGTAMVTPHQDTAHGAHDVSDRCIMHWTINQASNVAVIADALGGGSDAILPFDSACVADLKAALAN